jgi:glycosyltransferase involved in cell wall biosynthesis
MSSPTVSVVIAAYNAGATLADTLASVAAQTFQDFELIVVDDGSSDNTAHILQQHAQQHPWMLWVTQVNRGASAARQAAIAMARSELIAFLDADDLWTPDKLHKQVALMQAQPQVILSCTNMIDFFPDRDDEQTLFERKPPQRGMVLEHLFQRNFIYTPTVMVRKTALQAVGGFNPQLKVNEDYDLWLRLANDGPFDFIDQVLGRRRVLMHSLTRANQMACYAQDLALIDFWVAKRSDLFDVNATLVKHRRSVIHSRMGEHLMGVRDFSGARQAYRQALLWGARDKGTLMRCVAAHCSVLMYAFWWLKARFKT